MPESQTGYSPSDCPGGVSDHLRFEEYKIDQMVIPIRTGTPDPGGKLPINHESFPVAPRLKIFHPSARGNAREDSSQPIRPKRSPHQIAEEIAGSTCRGSWKLGTPPARPVDLDGKLLWKWFWAARKICLATPCGYTRSATW